MYVLRVEQGDERVPGDTQHSSAGHQTVLPPGSQVEGLEEGWGRQDQRWLWEGHGWSPTFVTGKWLVVGVQCLPKAIASLEGRGLSCVSWRQVGVAFLALVYALVNIFSVWDLRRGVGFVC